MRVAVQPWRNRFFSQGRSLEEARALYIRTREAQLLEEKTGKPIYTVIHDCNTIQYLDYNPEEEPEKFSCVCQTPLDEGLSRWVCQSGHSHIVSSNSQVINTNCNKCDEIENTPTRTENENERLLRIIRLRDSGIDIDANGRVNPDVHRNEEFIRQRDQARLYADIEAQKIKDAIHPLISEIHDIVTSFKEYLREEN